MSGTGTNRRHSRDDVARTALQILDEFGLPDLTMRRLAAALDVQPSALYWHFPNKQTLLAELADRIVSPPATAATSPDPADGIRSQAADLRNALLAYRDGAEVVSSTLALGLGSTAAVDRLAAAIAAEGFEPEMAHRSAIALLHFVLGHVSHEQQRMQYDSLGVVSPVDGIAPFTANDPKADDPTAEFAFGVDLLVRGLESHRLQAQQQGFARQ